MADDCELAQAVGDHLRRNIAGMGTGLRGMAILRTDQQGRVFRQCSRDIKKRHRRAQENVDLFGELCVNAVGYRLDLIEIGPQSVHLPVSRNQRTDIGRHQHLPCKLICAGISRAM